MRYPGRDKEVYDIRTERVVNRKHRRIIKKNVTSVETKY